MDAIRRFFISSFDKQSDVEDGAKQNRTLDTCLATFCWSKNHEIKKFMRYNVVIECFIVI